ncbi:Mu transposase C-terminal domain-containing protein [Alicyclobacillus dauci]|uniref:DDE-type integrase/transposase/recombinase n=1 Tax=Alicyclobacillus dauci TaxID=1475485 RepID=A0ABY6Z3W0_9BACL|nr:Mu transposase C-terminal domain-containing protein [Alicyclobacillus dauci]WAH37434.1 DDE-type integrase/transposase/recombinase [Alicyclobacillus dauci]
MTYRSLLDTLNDKQRKEVGDRLEMIRPVLLLERAKQNDIRAIYQFTANYKEYLADNQSLESLTREELIAEVSRKYSVPNEYGVRPRGASVRSIKRYLAAYKAYDLEFDARGEEGLATKKGNGYLFRKDNRTIEICHPRKPDMVLGQINVRLSDGYLPMIKEAIEQEYLTIKRPTKKAIHQSISIRCLRQGIEPLSYETVKKILGRIDPQIRTRMRDGNKAAEVYDPVTRGFSNEEAQYPLHIVELDHTELDLDILDGNTGYVIGRPWITLGIDVFSRMIWCLYVSFEPPSANVVRKAIEHGIYFKRAKERYGTFNEWECFGVPSVVYMDNGPEFRNTEVRRMITETIKSSVRYRPVRTPRYGGTIERLFGTLNKQLIHLLDGTRKSNPTDLGEYDPDKEAKLTLDDIRTILTMYIVDHYHMTPHRGLPLNSDTPIVRYREGLHMAGFPPFITPDQEEALSIELLPAMLKPYTRDGVRLNNVSYKLDSLAQLIDKREKKYKIKYDIDDISKIYLQRPGSEEYVRVPAVQPRAEEIHQVNWYTWKQIRDIMRAESKEKRESIPGTQRVVEARKELENMIKEKYRSGRKARQKAARMNLEVMISEPTTNAQKDHGTSLKDKLRAARMLAEQSMVEGNDE